MLSASRQKLIAILLAAFFCAQAQAVELLHFIEGGDHAEVFADASGIRISDQGVV